MNYVTHAHIYTTDQWSQAQYAAPAPTSRVRAYIHLPHMLMSHVIYK